MEWFASALAAVITIFQAQALETPQPEPIEVAELPLPPVAPSNSEGACTTSINPHRTGCVGTTSDTFQAGDFTPDGRHILVSVEFIGAPAAPDPASIYTGQQLIVVKTDGLLFPNGDPWKCLSRGVPVEQAQSLDPQGIILTLLETVVKLYGATIY